jgi:Chaperone of endosialidase
VGVNCIFPPGNKLQVGDMGPAGYNGNDIAFGNGTEATAITQTSISSQFASTTDFVFLPKYGTGGRVGINTSTPAYPLDVSNSVSSPSICYAYFARNGPCEENIGGSIGSFPVSIYASSRVLASEFDAFSDERIKNINGISNTTNDLETINAIKVTDYTMKDKIKYGNKQFKKVIAQEMEKTYPQVVSKHTDFIPNVYQVPNKIKKTANGYLLSFASNHHISNTAKKIQMLIEGEGSMQQFDIVSIPSTNEVIINVKEIKGDKVFVYGEEVDDFRTVDYEGLTTLNISATQELSKLVAEQNKKIEVLAAELKMLKEKQSVGGQAIITVR